MATEIYLHLIWNSWLPIQKHDFIETGFWSIRGNQIIYEYLLIIIAKLMTFMRKIQSLCDKILKNGPKWIVEILYVKRP